MTDHQLHTPDGVRDYLTAEFDRKNRAELAIDRVFRSYGYKRVKKPTFEYIEVFEGKGSVTNERMYKFTDHEGSVCALRPDMTPAIARIAATRYGLSKMPLRLSYISNTFRDNEAYHGKLKEITQAGVELLGVSGDAADAEVIALSVRSLLAAGLTDFRADIGSVGFFKAVMDEMALPAGRREELQSYVLEKDFVSARRLVNAENVAPGLKTLIGELPLFIGGEETLARARSLVTGKAALEALSQLSRVYQMLNEYGVCERVAYDLSMIGYLDYYTGVIWSAYASGAASNVLSGGRYDGLLRQFGTDQPAAGFAIKINELMSALGGAGVSDDVKLLASEGVDSGEVVKTAEILRLSGLDIEMSLVSGGIDGQIAFAKLKDLSGVIFMRPGTVEIVDFMSDGRKTLPTAEFLESYKKIPDTPET